MKTTTSPTSSCRSGSPVSGAPPADLIVSTVSLRNFRSYAKLELSLDPGLVLVVGPNGAGKTNLLESLHVGTQGFSPRTRADAQLIRFGENAARVTLGGRRGQTQVQLRVDLAVDAGKKATVNGAPLRAAEQLRGEAATLVFTPDRLAVVKGGPAVRRAYFDRTLGRLSPARAQLAAEYGAAVAQRNAGLRRIAAGYSARESLAPWTERVAALGTELVLARREAIASLVAPFAARAEELGLPECDLRYSGTPPTREALEARLEQELERGVTGIGPHLDEFAIVAGPRELRSFGSQGEQRLAVLSLLLAEAELISDRRGIPPLLLLDDVLSELDPDRRRLLASRVAAHGQALVTATDASSLPTEPAQLLRVRAGEVS
ncbi:MAG: DNA replication/repair protein RecF [Gaiellaceae bacterium]